jgi:hypothetical protein
MTIGEMGEWILFKCLPKAMPAGPTKVEQGDH